MNRGDKSWGWNVCQKLEAMCMDLDGLVCKDIGNQMQTVGESVKKLYSDVMQDFRLADPAQHILPLKCFDLVSVVNEDSVDSQTNAPVVPETCYKPSTSAGVIHSEQITEYGNLRNTFSDNTIQESNVVDHFPGDDDHSAKISCESSENHLDDMPKHKENIKVEPLLMSLKEKCDEEPSANISCESSESRMSKNEDTLCDADSQCDDSEFEDCWSATEIFDDMSDPEDIICDTSAQSDDSDGWGEALDVQLNLDTEGNNEVQHLIYLKEKCDDDHTVNMSLDSSQNRLGERIKLEGMLCYASSQSDASECEDGWCETDIIELKLGIEEKMEVDPLSDTTTFEEGWDIPNIIDLNFDTQDKKVESLEEKKTLLNCSINELDCDSSTHQTSELETSLNRNENKENCCQTESVGDFSVSSFGLSSCGSSNYSTSFTSSSYYAVSNDTTRSDETLTGVPDGSSTADCKDAKLGRKIKSCKKMIQNVFMSRKRLSKEYKQLAVLHGDIDNVSNQEKKVPSIGTMELPDSEWEFL